MENVHDMLLGHQPNISFDLYVSRNQACQRHAIAIGEGGGESDRRRLTSGILLATPFTHGIG